MNFEHLETIRTSAIEQTLTALTDIVKDSKVDLDTRLKAAKQIDSISDTMVHAYLIANATAEDSSTKHKLLKSIDKLHGDHGENH